MHVPFWSTSQIAIAAPQDSHPSFIWKFPKYLSVAAITEMALRVLLLTAQAHLGANLGRP
jgi:hypothetical protein